MIAGRRTPYSPKDAETIEYTGHCYACGGGIHGVEYDSELVNQAWSSSFKSAHGIEMV